MARGTVPLLGNRHIGITRPHCFHSKTVNAQYAITPHHHFDPVPLEWVYFYPFQARNENFLTLTSHYMPGFHERRRSTPSYA